MRHAPASLGPCLSGRHQALLQALMGHAHGRTCPCTVTSSAPPPSADANPCTAFWRESAHGRRTAASTACRRCGRGPRGRIARRLGVVLWESDRRLQLRETRQSVRPRHTPLLHRHTCAGSCGVACAARAHPTAPWRARPGAGRRCCPRGARGSVTRCMRCMRDAAADGLRAVADSHQVMS